MNKFIEQVIEETFASKKQQRYFYHKAENSPKWKKMAKEFSNKTDFSKLPEEAEEEESELHMNASNIAKEKEVEEIVDADGNISTSDMPGNPNGFIRSKRTSDEVAKASMGMMGSFGVLGGNTSGNKTLKYWAESDMSKALGAKDTIMDPKVDNYKDAEEYFEDELDVPEDEAKDRVEKLGYDKELPDGKIRLIENPKKYIEEYLAKKSKDGEFVHKDNLEKPKKKINPILLKQLQSIKQSLKNNGLTSKDITEYLEDYNE